MLNKYSNWLQWFIVGLALLGLFDATYLAAEHLLGVSPVCFVSHGCDLVLTSQYAAIGPVPISLLGVGYYLVVLVLAIQSIGKRSGQLVQLLTVLTGLGFLTSLGLVYLQLAVIKAICAYCMLSATTSTLLFISALANRRVTK